MSKPTQTKTASDVPETPKDKCECGAIAPELCKVYGHLQPQAQHSPLPKQIHYGKVDDELVDENGFYLGLETKNEVIRRYNHAEALAEALRHLMAITRNDEALQYREAREALANWEGAK